MTPHAIIALHAIMNRIMTDSQRRAVFAKMREGGGGRQGGPVKPNLPKEGGGRKVLPIKPNLPQQPQGPKVPLAPMPGAGPNYSRSMDFRDADKNGVDDRDEGGPVYELAVIRNPDGSIGRKFEPNYPGMPRNGADGDSTFSPPLSGESTQRVPGYGTDPENRGKTRTADWRDKDKDGVDDRDQDGPGMPKYDTPTKARPPAGAGGAQTLPTPPSGNPKMPSPPRTGGPKMPDLPSPPRGYTPGDMQFFTSPPKIGADGYITGPNGKKFTPTTYEQSRQTYERAVERQNKLRKKLLEGQKQKENYGKKKKKTPNKDLPSSTPSPQPKSTVRKATPEDFDKRPNAPLPPNSLRIGAR